MTKNKLLLSAIDEHTTQIHSLELPCDTCGGTWENDIRVEVIGDMDFLDEEFKKINQQFADDGWTWNPETRELKCPGCSEDNT